MDHHDSTEGKEVVLVTGASQGIGRSVASRYASRGSIVWAVARSPQPLEMLEQEHPEHIFTQALDIRDTDALDHLFARITEEYGRLDILINNASILGPMGPLASLDDTAFAHTVSINTTGTFFVTRRAIDLLGASSRRGRAGRIVHLSSSVGRRVRAEWGAYSISKVGVEALNTVLAAERDDLVTVTLNPGGTATQMRALAYPEEDLSTLPTPDDVARTIELLTTLMTPDVSGRRYSSRALFPLLDEPPQDAELLPHEDAS